MTIRSNKQLLIAHHPIWTAYGWWLPNDPRGSMSKTIASDVIAELGDLNHGRKNIQPIGREIRQFYRRAAPRLKHRLRTFTRRDIRLLGEAFRQVVESRNYTCYACAILQDHIHLLIRKHRHRAEEMMGAFQRASRDALHSAGLWPIDHPVWGGPGWKVFLFSPGDIRRTIHYVDNNPVKHRLGSQHWDFVSDYDNWPLHIGHNPNSPYARRLRRGDS